MVRLISYNIQYEEGNGKGLYEYLNIHRLLRSNPALSQKMASFLSQYNPDIVGLLEVDAGSSRTNHVDQASILANALGMEYIVEAGKYAGRGFHWLLRKLPIMSKLSNAILTRKDIGRPVVHVLSRGMKNIAIQLPFTEPKPFNVLLLHLALRRKTRLAQLKEVSYIVKNIDTPVVVVGDFNTFKTAELQVLLSSTRLHDAYLPGADAFTQPSWNPKYRLDNVLVSPDITVENYQVLQSRLSDHLPVLVDFSLS